MATKKFQTKDDLVKAIVHRQKDVIDNNILEPSLIDLLVPLSGADGKIKAIDGDGNVTIEFTAPVASHLKYLTKKKLQALVAVLDEITPGRTG
jgi:hypothetical protein